MHRLFPLTLIVVIVLSLGFVAEASAMRVPGPASSQASDGPTAAGIRLGDYLTAVGPVYAELTDCACCCGTLALPSHRCADCATAATKLRQIVARIHRTQSRLARLTVPASLSPVHARLVAALDVMHVGGEYMAVKVRTAPQSLVVSIRALPGAHARPPLVWRVSPDVARDARLAAFLHTRPSHIYRTQYLRALDAAVNADPGITGSPAEQALAHLALWRDEVTALAQRAGLSLPAQLAS
jgi:hypothetical protein